jgi:hypothetical protein
VALLDFSTERRSLVLGGRRFDIRRLTVGAVSRALVLLAREIAAVRKMYESEPELWEKFGASPALLMFPPTDPRVVDVLRRVVVTDEPVAAWPVEDLVLAVAGLSDWPRITGSLRWSDSPGQESDRQEEARSVLSVAKECGTDPVSLMDWPYEAFCAALDAMAPEKKAPIGPEALAVMLNGPGFEGA